MLTRLRRWFDAKVEAKVEAKAVQFSQSWVDAYFGATGSATGETVSTRTAMRLPAFHRGVMVIADGLAQLPLILHRRAGNGIEPAVDHPLYDLMMYRANGWQDATEWLRTTIMHAVASGQAVSYRNVVNGTLRELIPIRPEYCAVDIRPDLDLEYAITFENGRQMVVGRDEVFHLRGPSWDSARGLDPVQLGQEAIGLAQAAEKSQASIHRNGVKATGLFTLEGASTEEQRQAVRDSIRKLYAGAGNAGTPILAPAGLKFTDVSMKGTDAEHLDTRKHQIEEVARLLGVFSIMLGHAGDSSPTFASAEAFFDAHVRYTLQPWIKSLVSACNCQLLTSEERRDGYEFRMDTSELLRGSLRDRAEYYDRAIRGGWMTRNEAREDDGWNPLPCLDQPMFPLNMGEVVGGEGGAVASPVGEAKAGVDSYTPTEEMAAEARRGLEWREEHGRGGTEIGVARARDISNRRSLSPDTVMRMVSYFARHEVDKQGQGWSPGQEGYPSAGKIAWLLWGGDAGRAWANRIARELNEDE